MIFTYCLADLSNFNTLFLLLNGKRNFCYCVALKQKANVTRSQDHFVFFHKAKWWKAEPEAKTKCKQFSMENLTEMLKHK